MPDRSVPPAVPSNPYAAPHSPGVLPQRPAPGSQPGQPFVPGVVFNGANLQAPPPSAQTPWGWGRARWWWALAVVALLVPAVGGLLQLPRLVQTADVSDLVQEQPSDTYSITDRPGWNPLVEHGQRLSDTYLAKMDDGTIFEIVPQTQEGVNYAHDFLVLLADENSALLFATQTSDDPAELDAVIQETRDRFDELERMFLAGEDFDVDISITRSDGTTYTSDGNNHADDDASTP
ncbi:hypothetical protein ACTHAM_000752 [Cellulomonas soli]|uniref:hypothetical protein n=1 Tax=Cellulomonas soli TaxID=931535 RepID=UPI003F86C09C